MFKKSSKDTLVEQAQGLASNISEAAAPHIERAQQELGPRLSDAKDVIAPKLAEAREQAAPYVESARDRLVNDVVPAVKKAAADVAEQAAPVVEEAKQRGSDAAAALAGQQKKKSGKKKWFFFAALAGAAAFVANKLKSGSKESANWQSSYTPAPAPAPAAPSAPPSPSAPAGGAHLASTPVDGPGSGDAAGANPGESISDSIEEPHPVTTPDAPAEEVAVDGAAPEGDDAPPKAKKKA
jgi:hypothetical protein